MEIPDSGLPDFPWDDMYTKTAIYTKLSQIIPNDQNICQITTKYNERPWCFQSKAFQNIPEVGLLV
jgi:hypothetical protein